MSRPQSASTFDSSFDLSAFDDPVDAEYEFLPDDFGDPAARALDCAAEVAAAAAALVLATDTVATAAVALAAAEGPYLAACAQVDAHDARQSVRAWAAELITGRLSSLCPHMAFVSGDSADRAALELEEWSPASELLEAAQRR
jgi:hypothetical protein